MSRAFYGYAWDFPAASAAADLAAMGDAVRADATVAVIPSVQRPSSLAWLGEALAPSGGAS